MPKSKSFPIHVAVFESELTIRPDSEAVRDLFVHLSTVTLLARRWVRESDLSDAQIERLYQESDDLLKDLWTPVHECEEVMKASPAYGATLHVFAAILRRAAEDITASERAPTAGETIDATRTEEDTIAWLAVLASAAHDHAPEIDAVSVDARAWRAWDDLVVFYGRGKAAALTLAAWTLVRQHVLGVRSGVYDVMDSPACRCDKCVAHREERRAHAH